MNRRQILLAGIAAVAASAAAWMRYRRTSRVPELSAVQETQGQDDAPEATIPDMALGDENAPVTVIEYASFTCPHCRRFHEEVFPTLRREYIDTGKVRFVLREVYFDRYGLWAAMVARCDPQRYWGIVDMIFETQDKWIRGESTEVVQNLRRIGRVAGLSDEELDRCLGDQAFAERLVAAYQRHAERDGINATPTFVIDGQKYSNMAWTDFRAVLEEKLAAKADH